MENQLQQVKNKYMYSVNQLMKLSNIENHKIKFDGYDYWWYAIKDNSYELHCIKPFSDYKTVLSYIKYWIPAYNELVINNDNAVSKMVNDVMNDVRIYDIVNSDLKTIDKVISILDIKPYLSQTEIAEYLNISKMAINKHIKRIKKYV